MTSAVLYALVGTGIFGIGLSGLITRPHLLIKILSFNLMATGASMLLVGLASHGSADADPVPQAMVLTGIVVAVSATAVALALVARISRLDPGSVEASD